MRSESCKAQSTGVCSRSLRERVVERIRGSKRRSNAGDEVSKRIDESNGEGGKGRIISKDLRSGICTERGARRRSRSRIDKDRRRSGAHEASV